MNRIVIKKTRKRVEERNRKLARELDLVTKRELIDAVLLIAEKLDLEIEFTYEKRKSPVDPGGEDNDEKTSDQGKG